MNNTDKIFALFDLQTELINLESDTFDLLIASIEKNETEMADKLRRKMASLRERIEKIYEEIKVLMIEQGEDLEEKADNT